LCFHKLIEFYKPGTVEANTLLNQGVAAGAFISGAGWSHRELALLASKYHYTLKPSNPIPHLVVINGVKDGFVYYNDPAEESAGIKISVSDFIKAWKKRFIAIRPI